jgi:hypothetical protein
MTDVEQVPQEALDQLERTGSCARPVRIAVFREDRPDDDRVMLLPCKDRRASVCPACSHTYKGDAWQVVASGMQGGKGVPAEVGSRPRAFVTLTAPSFGPVHSRPREGGSERTCHPARLTRCIHGMPAECLASHEEGDALLGQPICGACFDYPGAVLWNAHVATLWQRTAKRTLRVITGMGEVGPGGLRLSYVKAAEFQRRGLVHLHVVVRADGDEGPEVPAPEWVTSALVIGALSDVIPRVTTSVPSLGRGSSRAVGWGHQMTATELVAGPPDDDRQMAVAAYVAKYATKTADSSGALAHRITKPSEIEHLGINEHHRRLVETAWTLGGHPELLDLRLRRCAHAFGYRGHVVTKSLRYSTTFSALRGVRADYCQNVGDSGPESTTDVHFGYAGRGYDDPGLGLLAFDLAESATSKMSRLIKEQELP